MSVHKTAPEPAPETGEVEAHRIVQEIRDVISGTPTTPTTAETKPAPTGELSKEWRCFHCDEVFTDAQAAADHFGVQIDGVADEVACQLTKDEKGIVAMLRDAHRRLDQYQMEDNASYREFYRLGAEHSTALIKAEEVGYEKGLKDGRALDLGQSRTQPPLVDREALENWWSKYSGDRLGAIHWSSALLSSGLIRPAPTREQVDFALDHAEQVINGHFAGASKERGERTNSQVRTDAILSLFHPAADKGDGR